MFEENLAQLDARHLLRRLRLAESAPGPVVTFAGRPLILMAANDYLGLATHPTLKQAALDAVGRFGVGSGASRLISGTLPPHADLETALARFKGTEASLLFGSGYLANIGLIPALAETGDLILADRLCHASLIDGCRLSGASFRVFRHRDLAHLEQLLAKCKVRRTTLIVTDGVFSMDGDLAPLPDLIALAERYDARLLVDDAHGTGVMGKTGRGTLEHFGVEARLPFHMGTLSKALGGSGAYVAGPTTLIQYLVNHARSFIYTTAPPPAAAAAALAALDVIRNEPERRTRLWANRQRWVEGLVGLGYRIADTASPIVPVLIGQADQALQLAERLLQLGVFAPAIRPPTVPEGTSRIRTTLSSEHRPEHLDHALAAFRQAGQELRLI
ncbi:MAG: 8-amino-7-oxononanoate synthase [Nitrospirae bacterium]|nr:MAG: 8-amino-7-oxononanoate synthase [Nitrospirota bacterium]